MCFTWDYSEEYLVISVGSKHSGPHNFVQAKSVHLSPFTGVALIADLLLGVIEDATYHL